MDVQRVFKQGNSWVVAIPPRVLRELGWPVGSYVSLRVMYARARLDGTVLPRLTVELESVDGGRVLVLAPVEVRHVAIGTAGGADRGGSDRGGVDAAPGGSGPGASA